MSTSVPRQVPLRDPRSFRFAQRMQKDPQEKEFLDYLIQLHEGIQNLNRQIRDALVSGTVSGTLVLDDGANWRVTITINHGRVTAVTTAASSGAACTWT